MPAISDPRYLFGALSGQHDLSLTSLEVSNECADPVFQRLSAYSYNVIVACLWDEIDLFGLIRVLKKDGRHLRRRQGVFGSDRYEHGYVHGADLGKIVKPIVNKK